jgi:hypothetical protein
MKLERYGRLTPAILPARWVQKAQQQSEPSFCRAGCLSAAVFPTYTWQLRGSIQDRHSNIAYSVSRAIFDTAIITDTNTHNGPWLSGRDGGLLEI